ncbi:MAG: hypothetical protein E7595_06295 [Ruminococcaceae bacterium]|nr:hypothetical protein [Oscillospiraceae bacterium]
MKSFRFFINTALILSILALTAMSVANAYIQGKRGGHTIVSSNLSEEDKKWIDDNFGHCETIEELIIEANKYAFDNFVYDLDKTILLPVQYFDFTRIRTEMGGICYDFACWMKAIALRWGETHGEETKAFVLIVRTNGTGHAYNIIKSDGKTLYTDVTKSAGGGEEGTAPYTFCYVGDRSFDEFASEYGEIIISIL